MKSSAAIIKPVVVFVLLTVCGSALAEYKAIVKECEATPSMEGCRTEKNFFYMSDDTDIQACEAMADNINEIEKKHYDDEMEKNHYDWSCGFMISANKFLLSKPQWVEVTSQEKCNALGAVSDGYRKSFTEHPESCAKLKYQPIYGFPYNLDGDEGDEKIYTYNFPGVQCQISGIPRVSLWTAKKDGSSLGKYLGADRMIRVQNSDPVIYASRLYFIEYDQGVTAYGPEITGENNFAVYRIVKYRQREAYLPVCLINSIKSSVKE